MAGRVRWAAAAGAASALLGVLAIPAPWSSPEVGAARTEPSTQFGAPPPPYACTAEPVPLAALASPPARPRATPPADGPVEARRSARARDTSDLVGALPAADAADRAAVEDLERRFAACWNAGDLRRVAALWTAAELDRWVRLLAAAGEDPAAFFATFFEGEEPIGSADWVPVRVGSVLAVGGGRLVALVDFCDFRQLHYYARDGDAWRIDGIFPVKSRDGACRVQWATPRPADPPTAAPGVLGPFGDVPRP